MALPSGLRPEGITSGPGGLVWAVGNVGTIAHVWAVSSRTGRVVVDVVVPGGSFLNDLVVTRSTVWVTDSRVDRLTAIALTRGGRPTGQSPTFVPLSGDWPAGNGVANNANGIRELPDGSLLLNNSRVGGLWQVNPDTGRVREIDVTGRPGITSGDGLEIDGNTVFNVRGSGQREVSVLRLERRRGRGGRQRRRYGIWSARWVRALTDETLDVPSTATVARGALWAVNARFGVAEPNAADYWITRLALR